MSKEQYIEVPEKYTRRELNARYREIPLKDTTSRLLRKYFNAMANLYGIIPLHKAKEIIFSLSPKLVTEDEFLAFAEIARHECEDYYILGGDELYSKFSNTTRMPCNRGYTPDEMMQMTPPEERFKSLSLGPNIRKSLQTGEMDIEDFRKQILTMELPSEAMRFDLLRQLADIKPPVTQPEKQKKVGRNDPCPCGSGKKYKRCCGK